MNSQINADKSGVNTIFTQSSPKFVRTTALNKILALKKPIKVIQGGTSASKTFSILAILIDKAIKNPGLEISVVSETIPHLRRGAIKDFVKIMTLTKRWDESRFNKTLLRYNFPNTAYIEFFPVDSGLLGSRRDILFMNECINTPYNAYEQLALRTRRDIFLDYNPSQQFWVHTEVLNSPDAELLILTYKDNEALPENVMTSFNNYWRKAEEEKARGLPETSHYQNFCKVFIRGETGSLEGVVFTNWQQCDAIPAEAKLISDGLDYGFTNDPTAYIGVWKHNGELFVKQFIYESGLTNQDISARIKSIPRKELIVAESAEPKSNEELRRMGHSVQAVQKGKDSIRHSINTLQQFKINVTKDSVDFIRELRTYRWLMDNKNQPTNEPIDYNNHCIDALRYVALAKIRVGQAFNTSFGIA